MSIVSVDNIQPIGSGTSVTVNSAATLVLNNVNSTGVVTATSFVGALPISNDSNNRVITATGSGGLNGESGLTFDGNSLTVTNASSNTAAIFSGGGGAGSIQIKDGDDGTIAFVTVDGGNLSFKTSGSSYSDKLLITPAGQVGINQSSPARALTVNALGTGTSSRLVRLATQDNNTRFDFSFENANYLTIQNGVSDSAILKLHTSGYVQKPSQPVFIAYRVNSYNSTTTATPLVYDSEQLDIGGNYNPTNGRFTAPVTGLYEFAYAAIAGNTATVYRYDLRVNGALPYNPLLLELRIDQSQSGSEYGTNGEYVCYVNMTAGQYAQVYVHSDNTVNNVYGSSSYGYTYFRGRLIG